MNSKWIAKTSIFVFWPFIAVLMVAFFAVLFLFVWVVIPFGTLQKKEDGGYTMIFPWNQQNHETR